MAETVSVFHPKTFHNIQQALTENYILMKMEQELCLNFLLSAETSILSVPDEETKILE